MVRPMRPRAILVLIGVPVAILFLALYRITSVLDRGMLSPDIRQLNDGTDMENTGLNREDLASSKMEVARVARNCDPSQLPDGARMGNSKYLIPSFPLPNDNLGKFTVLMLTYNRLSSLPEVVQHYICMPSVDRLVLLWSNAAQLPPLPETLVDDQCRDRLIIKQLTSNSLTLRFSLHPEIRTDAIFNVDDDLMISEADLERGFRIWRENPWGLVGYISRGHTSSMSELQYVAMTSNVKYSFILTAASFLHKEYLRMFVDRCPGDFRSEMDRQQNCEDLFMNFLVKDHCRCSGVFLVEQSSEIGLPRNSGSRLHGRGDDFKLRSRCINKFAHYFSDVRLDSSTCTYT